MFWSDSGGRSGLLTTILNYYGSYHDDADFRLPIKQRHREAVHLNCTTVAVSKDLSEEEFILFRQALGARSHGKILSCLATVQYYQALRISEVAALHWEDIHFDWKIPQNSRIRIVRSVCYPHRKDEKAFLKGSFKNATVNGGVKKQPMFPETHEALKALSAPGANDLIFSIRGELFPYKNIQCRYDLSFKKAGLPYRGTHVMRHSGCRRVFNESGEIPIAQQLLGNVDLKTTLVYAKRHASALTKVAHQYWEKNSRLLANPCNGDSKNKIKSEIE